MTQDILIMITIITIALMSTICFIVHQVFKTRRMRIEYDGGYTEEEIKEIVVEKFKLLASSQSLEPGNFIYTTTTKETNKEPENKKGRK
jgi:hypothetical protein|nr:MAG TPA: hypothetical protein [Caudoviricetes sp.]